MGIAVPTMSGSFSGLNTSTSAPGIGGSVAHQRAPTDPYYYAGVYVKNMVIGSAWMLGYDNAGTFTELDSGICVASDFTIPGVPSYGSPFLLQLRTRKGTSDPKYKPIRSYAYHSQSGVDIYVSQVADEVA